MRGAGSERAAGPTKGCRDACWQRRRFVQHHPRHSAACTPRWAGPPRREGNSRRGAGAAHRQAPGWCCWVLQAKYRWRGGDLAAPADGQQGGQGWAVLVPRMAALGDETGDCGRVSFHDVAAAAGSASSGGTALTACRQLGRLALRPAGQLAAGRVLAGRASTRLLSAGGGVCAEAGRLEGREWHHVAAGPCQLRALQAVQSGWGGVGG